MSMFLLRFYETRSKQFSCKIRRGFQSEVLLIQFQKSLHFIETRGPEAVDIHQFFERSKISAFGTIFQNQFRARRANRGQSNEILPRSQIQRNGIRREAVSFGVWL